MTWAWRIPSNIQMQPERRSVAAGGPRARGGGRLGGPRLGPARQWPSTCGSALTAQHIPGEARKPRITRTTRPWCSSVDSNAEMTVALLVCNEVPMPGIRARYLPDSRSAPPSYRRRQSGSQDDGKSSANLRPARLRAIRDCLYAAKIDRFVRKLLGRLPHPFTAADRRAGCRYDISIVKAEFALTQVLDRPVSGRAFFENVSSARTPIAASSLSSSLARQVLVLRHLASAVTAPMTTQAAPTRAATIAGSATFTVLTRPGSPFPTR